MNTALKIGGYTLRLADRSRPAGTQAALRFQILGPDGAPVTDYRIEPDRDLHLIAVNRDLSHFQHVHPVLDPEGTWAVPLDLSAPGEYRISRTSPRPVMTADSSSAPISQCRPYQPTPLPEPAAFAKVVDGYEVTHLWGAAMSTSAAAATTDDGMGGMDHGGMSGMGASGQMSAGTGMAMPGRMSDAQIQELTEAAAADFDRLFLQLLIVHHQGAIEMADTEIAQGGNPAALALAESIKAGQTAEITQMQQLLNTL